MDELWILGFLGGGAGAALGLPIAVSRSREDNELGAAERLLGIWIVGVGIALALIGAEHGGLLNGPAARFSGHASRMFNLVAWPMLVVAASRIARQPASRLDRSAMFAVPLAIYMIAMLLMGGRSIRFLWVLPASAYGAVRVTYVCYAGLRAQPRLDARTRRLLIGLAVMAVSLASAQTIRTFAPRFGPMRESVPVVVTVGIFWLATVVQSRLVSVRATPSTPYARNGLTDQDAGAVMAKLDRWMKDEELYRNPDLTLKVIAERIGETPHAISQAVNQQGGQSLNAYLAAWRVRHAQRELADPANHCFTIEAIGNRSGFASRSAFYRAFREHVGVTPAAYAKRRVS
jgi:AraC-like DNA-binding protein